MPDKPCHWETIDGLRVFIPGCMGGAVYGDDGCTCDRSGKRRKKRERQLDEIEEVLVDVNNCKGPSRKRIEQAIESVRELRKREEAGR